MPSNTSPRSHAAPARTPAVPRATARRPALAHHSSDFPDVIAGRAPLSDSLLSRGSVGGRFWIFAGCTVELVRGFEFCRLAQTVCLSILNCSRAFSPLDPHIPISRCCTVRLSCVSGFLFIIQCRWFTIPDFVRSHSSLVSSFRIVAAHSARLSVVWRLCVVSAACDWIHCTGKSRRSCDLSPNLGRGVCGSTTTIVATDLVTNRSG